MKDKTDRELIIFIGNEIVNIQQSNNRNFAHLENEINFLKKEIHYLNCRIENDE